MVYLKFMRCRDERVSHHNCGVELAVGLIRSFAGEEIVEESLLRDAGGKPYVDCEGVDFSISHSGRLVGCALYVADGEMSYDGAELALSDEPKGGVLSFAERCEMATGKLYTVDMRLPDAASFKGKIGLDIERVRHGKNAVRLDSIAKRYFRRDEFCYVVENKLNCERFFEIWTRKESYGKMLGGGLAGVLSEFDTMSGESCEMIKSFIFSYDGEEYIASVCFG